MTFTPDKHHRKSIRLKGYDYTKAGWYFITLCSFKRAIPFGDVLEGKVVLNKFGKIVEKFWFDIPKRYLNVDVDSYIIMPNHFHGIIQIIDDNNVRAIHESPLHIINRRKMLLPRIVGYLKMNTAKSINQLQGISGISVWQRNYCERVIRDKPELNRIRKYIIENPLKWMKSK